MTRQPKDSRIPTKPRTYGGSREGAGRRAVDGAEKLIRTNVCLDQQSLDIASEIGSGNVSAGIRMALKIAKEGKESSDTVARKPKKKNGDDGFGWNRAIQDMAKDPK